MIDCLRSELRRLLTVRSTLALSAATVAVAAGIGLFVSLVHPAGRVLPGPVSSAALTAGGASMPISVVGLLLGALAAVLVGHDDRYGQLALALLAEPRRGVLLTARLTVLAGLAVVVTTVASAVAFVACLVGGRPAGLDAVTLRTVLASIVVAVAWIWLAAGLTTLWRSAAATITALLVLPLVVEPLVTWVALLSRQEGLLRTARWLPFSAARALLERDLSGGPDRIGSAAAAGVVGLTTAVVLALAGTVLARRDV